MNENRIPVKKLRANGVVLSVWENEGAKGSFHTFTVQRVYKDSEGNWKTSATLRNSDLTVVADLCVKAFSEFCVSSWEPGGDDNIPF